MIESAGVDSGVVTAPYFHNSNSTEGLIEFFEVMNNASSIPLILYNIPAYVGETLPIGVVSKISQLNRFVGIKDSSGDLSYGLRLIDATSDEFAVLQGFDPLLIASLQMGFDGGVNALSNVVPEIYLSVIDNPTLADSNELQHRIIEPLFRLCSDHGFAPATKAALAYRGWLASATVRPPLTSLKPYVIADAMKSIFDLVDIRSS
jgi:4-hydroxy-tetrahydrodipicolinate synthase